MNFIKCLEKRKIFENEWISFYSDNVRFPDGSIGKYNRLVEKGGDGIVILPIDSIGNIGLIFIFRYPIGTFSWELPRGFGNNTTAKENAVREFSEEFGMVFSTINSLGKIFPNSGISATPAEVVYIENLERITQENLNSREVIERRKFFSSNEIFHMISTGMIKDSITISAIMLAVLNGIIKL